MVGLMKITYGPVASGLGITLLHSTGSSIFLSFGAQAHAKQKWAYKRPGDSRIRIGCHCKGESKRGTMGREGESEKAKPHLIFAYGTLKRGFPNHGLMEDLMRKDDAVLVGTYHTEEPYPLVCGPHGIPYLINLPGSGHRVKGEVYAVSDGAVVGLDEFEGVSGGYYERLPVVAVREAGGERVEAEAYLGHRSFGEVLWKMKGEVGLREYGEKEAGEYVRKEDRPGGRNTILDLVR